MASSIFKKLLAVQQEANTIPKSGYNAFNKYSYATEADVLAVRDLLNKHGLVAYPDVQDFTTLQRGESIQTLLHVAYTVVDVDTGESIVCRVVGQGEDKGDKGAYKASTGANKYFYLKIAGVATGDDPERDNQPAKPTKRQPSEGEGPHYIRMVNGIIKQHNLSKDQFTEITGIQTLQGQNAATCKKAWEALSSWALDRETPSPYGY